MFASSRALLRYGVSFTYIENCWLDSPVLEEGINQFIRTVSVVKSFKRLRILQLGTRPRQFLSVKINEGELLERFGIEVTPIEVTEILETVEAQQKNDRGIRILFSEWKDKHLDLSKMTDKNIRSMAAIELGIMELAEKYNCITAASECWQMFRKLVGVRVCFLFGDLTSKGFPVSCENDIHGSISSALLLAVSRMESPSFLADITVRHPTNDNAELLWHCGPFPATLVRPGSSCPLDEEGRGQWEVRGGDITLCRFDVDRGNYLLFADKVTGTNGPATFGNYVWVETKNWPAWEKRLMLGPYIHHIAGVHGDYKAALNDACHYIGVTPDHVE
jgi:L-fucose isomerase-like protein